MFIIKIKTPQGETLYACEDLEFCKVKVGAKRFENRDLAEARAALWRQDVTVANMVVTIEAA